MTQILTDYTLLGFRDTRVAVTVREVSSSDVDWDGGWLRK